MRILGSLLTAVTILSCGGDHSSPTGTLPPPGGTGSPPVIGFSKRSESESGITIPYQVWAPQNYSASTQWPVLVALAGTVERGSDGDKQISVGMGPYVRSQPNFPAVVVFPQIPSDETGRVAFDQAIYKIVADVIRDYNGDPTRVYLTGLSYGGTESFTILYANSAPFAGFIGVSAGICSRCIQPNATLAQAQALVAQKLKNFPISLYQGALDTNIPVATTDSLVAAFRAAGATSFNYTKYPNGTHTIWDTVYATPSVWTWLFALRR
jgi:predicted peptidase